MTSLFGPNTLREVANRVSVVEISHAVEIVNTWHHDYHHGTLRADKETSREQAYNQDIFIRLLGYREKPASPFTFEPKATTALGQLPDALITFTDPSASVQVIAAVVELKAASIDLDRPQRRDGNLSPVQQAFKYKTQYRECPFVIVSNFWELRLYNDNVLDYESWTLDDLVNPNEDYLALRTFFVLLRATSLTSASGDSETQRLLSDIRVQQEQIGRHFYAAHKAARVELLRDIYRKNPAVRDSSIDVGIEKAQKIVDRLVFACFAEDRGLLPDYSIQRVVQYAENSSFDGSLWSTLKGFFEAIDLGSAKLGIPQGYNGGLFSHDAVLNDLTIGDDSLRGVAALSRYNFAEDLSVNILGHIFEQSITDLEEIRTKVHSVGTALESAEGPSPTVSRRKRDGIFYTPDYIVRYIVDNTVGAYLRAKEESLKIEHRLKSDINDANYQKRESRAYQEYQDALHSIRVLDPACGSGAFLVHVFDYLLAEHQRVDAILGANLLSTEDYVRDILANNIYGVDLNEESVEITKLSLWLKTAQRGKKLSGLDSTIRCGNSLVDDSRYAGTKAFVWRDEFPEVFARGGFDVIVGNPPYVRSRDNVLDDVKEYLYGAYETLHDKANLYLLFIELSIKLLKPNGKFGFVVPNSWLGIESAMKMRQRLLQKTTLERFVGLEGESFPGIAVETVIFTLANTPPDGNSVLYQTVCEPTIRSTDYRAVLQTRWGETRNLIFDLKSTPEQFDLLDRLDAIHSRLSDYYEPRVGLQAYEKGKGNPRQTAADVRDHTFDYRYNFDSSTYPYLEGRDIGRFIVSWSGQWLRYGDWLSQPKELSQFSRPRLVIREITGHFPGVLVAAFADGVYLNNKSILNVLPLSSEYSLHFLLGILNSSIIAFYHQRRAAKGNRSLFPKLVVSDLKNYPVPFVDPEAQRPLHDLVVAISDRIAQRAERSERFERLIRSEFGWDSWPDRLAGWWRLDFFELIPLLRERVSVKAKDALLEVFEPYANECRSLDASIELLETQINGEVGRLYGLTEADLALVTESGEQTLA